MKNLILPSFIFLPFILIYKIGNAQVPGECLVISEVHYKPNGGGNGQNTREYVEIHNTSNTNTVDVAGFFIQSDRNNTPLTPVYGKDAIVSWDNRFPGTLPNDLVVGPLVTTTTKIPPGGHAIIINARWNSTTANPIDIADATIILTLRDYNFFGGDNSGTPFITPNDLLFNDGDFITLHNGDPADPTSAMIDSLGWTGEYAEFGISIQKDSDCLPKIHGSAAIFPTYEDKLDDDNSITDSISPGSANYNESVIVIPPPTDTICVGESILFPPVVFRTCSDYQLLWNFDDPASGASNTSTDASPTHTFNNPGFHRVILRTVSSCYADSIIFPVEVLPPLTSSQSPTICAGQSFTLPDGTTQNTTGTYVTTIPAANGCDSIITTDLTVSGILVTTVNPTICAGENHTLPNGNVVNASNTYITTVTSANGCDSTITTNLTVKPLNTFLQTPSICAGQSFTMPDGSTETAAGIYTHTLVGTDGCDSIVTTNITVVAPVTSTINPNICPGQIHTMPDGSTESTSGTYNYTLMSSNGCDSIVTVNLTVGSPLNTSISPSICAGENYTMPDGSVENSDGTYNFTLTAVGGCDSIVTVNLTVLSALTTTLNPSICDGESYTLPNGFSVNSSATYTTTLTASAGCDSIITTNLKVGGFLGTTLNTNICSGQNHTLPDGIVVNTSATYTSTIAAVNGCDSIITTNLTVSSLLTSTQTSQICAGQSFVMPDGTTETSAGIYTHTLTSTSGCDSIITTTLTVIDPLSSTQNPIICEGQNFTLPDGSIETSTGTYTHTLIASTGCDSIVTTNLTVNQNLVSTQNPIICAGESFTLPDGSVETNSGTYVHTITASTGCDSTVTTNLIVKPELTGEQIFQICDGESFALPDETVVNTAGSYTSTLSASDGCDSVVTTVLTVNPVLTTTLNPSICSGENYTLPNGNEVSESGTYTNIITSTTGCDSTVIINLSVGEITTTINPSICEGEVYSLPNGATISETGTYTDTLAAVGGCDSIVITNLTVILEPSISLGEDITIEQGQGTILVAKGPNGDYEWLPSESLDCPSCPTTRATPLETTSYTLTVTDENGCVASKSLTVEVLNDILSENKFYIPNAFTPNEDNTNPTFRPIGDLITENSYLFVIYDKWGQPIFVSQNPIEGWDGSFEGEIVPLDVYAWTLEFNDPQGELHKKSGKVTVLK